VSVAGTDAYSIDALTFSGASTPFSATGIGSGSASLAWSAGALVAGDDGTLQVTASAAGIPAETGSVAIHVGAMAGADAGSAGGDTDASVADASVADASVADPFANDAGLDGSSGGTVGNDPSYDASTTNDASTKTDSSTSSDAGASASGGKGGLSDAGAPGTPPPQSAVSAGTGCGCRLGAVNALASSNAALLVMAGLLLVVRGRRLRPARNFTLHSHTYPSIDSFMSHELYSFDLSRSLVQ